MTMEFLEALKQAKEVGHSKADFKVQWEKEREREEKNNEREEKDKEREERQKEREFNLQKIQKEMGGSVTTVKQEVGSVKGPRIPVFVDNREDLESYLKRFELLARANQWPESTWADRRGALLTGKALDVYSGLSDEESRDHRLRRGADTSRGQKRQNPCPSSLRASDMFAGVQQLISVHDNKLRSGTLLAFFGLY